MTPPRLPPPTFAQPAPPPHRQTMLFTPLLALLAVAATATASPAAPPLSRRDQVSVAYDNNYSKATNLPLASFACSDGANGLLTKGYTNIASLKAYASATPYVKGWNSPSCGKCYTVTYGGRSINVVAVDVGNSFVMGQDAMDALTGGQAVALGRVQANAVEVAASVCGL
ncbi:Cerato-platanin-domain-containing protein [Zopfochytrium polystomum]|nr:Cerato-platanin-domain-containing protein [Zopfochytrium polystomum]